MYVCMHVLYISRVSAKCFGCVGILNENRSIGIPIMQLSRRETIRLTFWITQRSAGIIILILLLRV